MASDAPEWATWSLSRSRTCAELTENCSASSHQEARPAEGSVANTIASHTATSLTTLLRHRADEQVFDSSWQDFVGDAYLDRKGSKDGEPNSRDARDEEIMDLDMLEALIKNVESDEAMGVSLSLTSYYENRLGLNAEKEGREAKYDYSPLSPSESYTLERCLRISNFIPPSPGVPDDPATGKPKQPLFAPDTQRVFDINGQARHIRYREKAKKAAKDAWPVKWESEDLEKTKNSKAIFTNMVTLFLPSRNVEWVIAQLANKITDTLGIHPSFALNPVEISLARKSVKKVRRGEMNPQAAAIVLHALATASNLHPKQVALVDAVALKRAWDARAHSKLKQRQLAEARSVTDTLKMLFPQMFDDQTEGDAKLSVDWMLNSAHHQLLKAILDLCDQVPGSSLAEMVREREQGKTKKTVATQTTTTATTPDPQEREMASANTDTPVCSVCRLHRATSSNDRASGEGETSTRATSTVRTFSEGPENAIFDELVNLDGARTEDNAASEPAESDWGELEGREALVAKVTSKHKSFDELTAYEQALVTYNGKIPHWVDAKLRRESRERERAEKERLMMENKKIKELQRKSSNMESRLKAEARDRVVRERRQEQKIERMKKAADKAAKEREQEERKMARKMEVLERIQNKKPTRPYWSTKVKGPKPKPGQRSIPEEVRERINEARKVLEESVRVKRIRDLEWLASQKERVQRLKLAFGVEEGAPSTAAETGGGNPSETTTPMMDQVDGSTNQTVEAINNSRATMMETTSMDAYQSDIMPMQVDQPSDMLIAEPPAFVPVLAEQSAFVPDFPANDSHSSYPSQLQTE